MLKSVRVPLLDLTVLPSGEEEVRLGYKLQVHHTAEWEDSNVIKFHVTEKSLTLINAFCRATFRVSFIF